MTPEQRAAILLGRDLADLDDQITRREEWMAAQGLQTGKIVVKGDGIDTEIDFSMLSTHKVSLSGGDLWTDTTNSKPLSDLKTWRRIIGQDSGLSPNVAVFGNDAWDAFVEHTKVQNLLDLRRIDLGIIDPVALPNGVTYQGFLKEVAIDLYTYDEWYYDEDTSSEKPMIDAKKVILGSTNARAARHYGMIQDMEAEKNFAVSRYPKSWVTKDPGIRWVMLQSAPVVCPHQIDGFLYAQVVA